MFTNISVMTNFRHPVFPTLGASHHQAHPDTSYNADRTAGQPSAPDARGGAPETRAQDSRSGAAVGGGGGAGAVAATANNPVDTKTNVNPSYATQSAGM